MEGKLSADSMIHLRFLGIKKQTLSCCIDSRREREHSDLDDLGANDDNHAVTLSSSADDKSPAGKFIPVLE